METDATGSESSPVMPVTLAGRWIIVVMFSFALLATGAMWAYWKLHTAPFLPLQQAIAAEFEDSAPLVQGGQRKMHQETPPILRITMRVDFDPRPEAAQARVEAIVDRLEELARETLDVSGYEVLEVHLFRKVAEEEGQTVTVERGFGEGL